MAISDAFVLQFFIRRSHVEVAAEVVHSIEAFRQATGPERLGWYYDDEGHLRRMGEKDWEAMRQELLDPRWRPACNLHLSDKGGGAGVCSVYYQGFWLDAPLSNESTACLLSFQLPTEYLEEHGPARVRALALELAGALPFNSGHGSLALSYLPLPRAQQDVRSLRFRYLGMSVYTPSSYHGQVGFKVPGAYWLTFLGQPVLGQLGGVAGLRARLTHPSISVEELNHERVLVTLGEQPQAGDVQAGEPLPLQRELARVLEPYLHHTPASAGPEAADLRRWERRLLD